MTFHAARFPASSVLLDITHLLKLAERVKAASIPALEELVAKLDDAIAVEGELEIGNLIQTAQKLLDLDDTDMARTLNVSRPTVGRWMRNVSSPHANSRKAICATLIKKARSKIRLLQD